MTQDTQKSKLIHRILTPLCGLFLTTLLSTTVSAQQMGTNAWSPVQQNRASIASLIYSVENGSSGTTGNGTTSTSSGDGLTQLVCGGGTGGDTNAGATGNSTCIILNNSGASIALDQLSAGDQTATADGTTDIDQNNTSDDDVTLSETINTLDGSSNDSGSSGSSGG